MLGFLALSLSLATAPLPSASQAVPEKRTDWVVQEVILPPVHEPGVVVSMEEAFACADLAGGHPDGGVLFSWSIHDPLGFRRTATYRSSPGGQEHQLEGLDRASLGPSRSALLDSPEGPRIVWRSFIHSGLQWGVSNLRTGELLLGRAGSTVPGRGQYRPHDFRNAGDLNGDGYDDAFITFTSMSLGTAVSLLDGRTLTEPWFHDEGDLEIGGQVLAMGLDRLPDLDVDGTPDHAYFANHPGGPIWDATDLVIRSGADGTELVRRTHSGWAAIRARFIPDIDGDGHAEIVAMFQRVYGWRSFVVLLDGATGAIIWNQDGHALQELYAPGDVYDYGVEAAFPAMTTRPRTGARELHAFAYVRSYSQGGVTALARLDLATGAVLSVSRPKETLDRWATPQTNLEIGPWFYPRAIGDIDRDGLEEFAVPAVADGWPSAGVGSESKAVVILGRRTLVAPGSAQLGQTVQVWAGIPTAGGRNCRLLASTRLVPGGVTINSWYSGFPASDPLLAASAAASRGVVRFDEHGRGSWQLRTPVAPALVGREIHLRGVVQGSGGQPWTLTTPASILLLP